MVASASIWTTILSERCYYSFPSEYLSSIYLGVTVGGAKDDWQSVATAALKDSCEAGRQAAADVGAALEDFDGDSTWFVLLG